MNDKGFGCTDISEQKMKEWWMEESHPCGWSGMEVSATSLLDEAGEQTQ